MTTTCRQASSSARDRSCGPPSCARESDGVNGPALPPNSEAARLGSAGRACPVLAQGPPQLRSRDERRLARFVVNLRHERLAGQGVVVAVLQQPCHLHTRLGRRQTSNAARAKAALRADAHAVQPCRAPWSTSRNNRASPLRRPREAPACQPPLASSPRSLRPPARGLLQAVTFPGVALLGACDNRADPRSRIDALSGRNRTGREAQLLRQWCTERIRLGYPKALVSKEYALRKLSSPRPQRNGYVSE